eukprot:CAMPEP_0185163466 /NCGR_PEP_ID=MMETSP1139-20130426/8027_1 /TAXON_ID=298111 /ORGANISM="Pavlova sp., Strain CCMP459" /LENGTH=328 /DNA_ID=CAMNT_0027728823 /DNA_START=72 /DNA_END=1054 /DNA_ORIENTATION=+
MPRLQCLVAALFLAITACLLAIIASARLAPASHNRDWVTNDLAPIAAVLPCTSRDGDWLLAKIKSCARTLDERNVRLVLVVAPRHHLEPLRQRMRDASVEIPRHWHLVAEDEVLPSLEPTPPARADAGHQAVGPSHRRQLAPAGVAEPQLVGAATAASKNGTRRPQRRGKRNGKAGKHHLPGWMLQQALKLLARHHPLIALARPRIPYVLTLDSDVVCTSGWAQAAPGGGLSSAISPLLRDAFLVNDGRIRTCVEPLRGWYGEVHLRRTAGTWNYSRWVDSAGATERSLLGAHVMGWTPQLLSVDAMDQVEAELVRRTPLANTASSGV